VSATSTRSTYETVRVDVDAGVGTITLARPEARNALSMQLKHDLAEAIAAVSADETVRAVVLTGDGPAFCAGGDIKEMAAGRSADEYRRRLLKVLETIAVPLARMPKPVIAAVNGNASGAGVSLAVCCDIVVAAESATFALSFVRMGLIPDVTGLYFLPRILGVNKAKELIFTGACLSAREAYEIGLVNRVVADEELVAGTRELARSLAAGPVVSYALSKRLIDQSLHVSLEDMVQLEAFAQAIAFSTPDHVEGAAAFRERRAPRFGRAGGRETEGEAAS
jgi:2-(1,2-epoxy-1,2-dihydrophenyl)acetyl-CoA isomerase